jgi:hypothetical protein
LIDLCDVDAATRQRLSLRTTLADSAAVLVPRDPGLSAKILDADMACLVRSVVVRGAVPDPLVADDAAAATLRLVLDGVLEAHIDGQWVTGAAAGDHLLPPPAGVDPASRLGRLSAEAARYGQALGACEPPVLSARMYFYNRIPASPLWRDRIGSEADLAARVGLTGPGRLAALVAARWHEVAPSARTVAWRAFRTAPARRAADRSTRPVVKLYLSPSVDDLPDAVAAALPVLADWNVSSFKIGRDAWGVLRPDKFVAYLPDLETLRVVAVELAAAVRGLCAHGVPFTAALDDTGLLSWGIDPPADRQLSTWQGTSWRRWICDCLAVALHVATVAPGRRPAWHFAFARLGLEGVDTGSWRPVGPGWCDAR